MNYTEVETLEMYGGFTNTTEEIRAELSRLITVASAMIEKRCNRVFAIATGAAMVAKTYSQENGLLAYPSYTLWLNEDLLTGYSIATLIGAPTITEMPVDEPYSRLWREDGYWEDPTTITGHWAYSLTTPPEIEQACLRLALSMFPQVNATGEPFKPDLPRDVAGLLAPYVRMRMP